MKKQSPARIVTIILGVLIVVLAVTFTINAQNTDEPLFFKNGTTLNYTVNKGGATNTLNVVIDAMKPDLVFDWTETGTASRKGHVTFHQQDFENGRNILSDLKDGDDRAKSNFLWFSRKQLLDLNSSAKTTYYLDNSTKLQGITVSGKEKMNVIVKGQTKSLDVIHAKSVMPGSSDEFWILNIKDNPLILKESIGGNTLEIKQINL